MRPVAQWLIAGAVAVAGLGSGTTTAAPCAALKQNLLTSSGCPSTCTTDPPVCVLYAPGLAPCEAVNTDEAGPCNVDKAFALPGTSDTCELTYQCLDSVVDKFQRWSLALVSNKNKVTAAPVTEIKAVQFPKDLRAVQVLGGTGKTAKGDVKKVLIDASLFETPPLVKSFFITDLNLRTILAKATFQTSWGSISFANTNLDAVPEQLTELNNFTVLDLSRNFLMSFPDNSSKLYPSLKNLTKLNLANNDLKDFTTNLPVLATLNLTGNPLGKIPEVVFEMKTLKILSLQNCNLTNVQLTEAQYAYLDQIPTFEADFTVTTCAEGYGPKEFARTSGKICMAGAVDPAKTAESKKSSGSSAGVAIGVAAGVLVLCGIAFVIYRRRKRSEYTTNTVTGKGGHSTMYETNDLTEGFIPGQDTAGSSSIWNDPDLLAVRIDMRDIEPIKLLSRGGFGEVWLGLYMNENVAIKRLLSDKKTMTDALAFATEIKTMARLEHPKIVRFIGVAWTNALTIQAVTEFMDCGDLRSLLDSNRASSLTWGNLKCQIAIDVADALVYLHTLNPKLIHRDLKSRNVLIDAHTGAKLSDFGISRNRSVEETMTAGVGTARWIAPEVILGGNYTEFADIYSFGIVLSELDTCKTPYHDAVNTNGAKMQDVTILQLVSAGKIQPTFSTGCPDSIIKLARACLAFDPAQRPSAIHISYELRKILKDEL